MSHRRDGWVSLWASVEMLAGIPRAFLEGGDELMAWLDIDYGIQVDGHFCTNYTRHGELVTFERLIEPLPASEGFVSAAVAAAAQLGPCSFVVALYDQAYDLARAGLPEDLAWQSEHLRFIGAFPYRSGAR